MAILVSFHAHPDDESIGCGGTFAQAAEDGHRVVLVVATKGEHGEVAEGFLAAGETLGERRVKETAEAAKLLGVARHEFLGYVDSGMMGTPTNDGPGAFWRADIEEAAQRLAAILIEEQADVLTIYDAKGTYGHPDHIQVHRVGVRAAEIARTPRVFESVVNRDAIMRQMDRVLASGVTPPMDPAEIGDELGISEDLISHAIDVKKHVRVKRAAMAAHASQISETSFFLAMPDEMFAEAFGTEWYTLRGAEPQRPMGTTLLD
jgi:LmbE family N-acetylglucosaminyl deacetylase